MKPDAAGQGRAGEPSLVSKSELTADLDIENSLALLLGPILYWFIFFKGTEEKPAALAARVVDAFWRAFGVVRRRETTSESRGRSRTRTRGVCRSDRPSSR